MNDFEVLMPEPISDFVNDEISNRYPLHKLWESSDPAAVLLELKDRIRGLATNGQGLRLIDAAFLSQFPNLEIIAHMGVGYDIVDAKWAAAHGIVVTNTPEVLNDDVADLAMGLLLATVRQLPQADNFLRGGGWSKNKFPLTATLKGRILGILGLGRIGKAIAKRAEAFGLRIIYHGRNVQKDVAYPFCPSVIELARACDILMVVAPGGPETRNIVGKDVLQALGPEGILINIARGSLVDEGALITALRDRKILSAGLDVFADEPRVPRELIEIEHAVLLPHVGSATHSTRQAMGQLVIDNLFSFAAGKGPLNPVLETPWPCKKS